MKIIINRLCGFFVMNELLKIIKDNMIIRRFILMNSFDGALTSLGLIIAMHSTGIFDVKLILVSSIGVIFATGISGFWGGYLVEKAERKHELSEIKKIHPKEDLAGRKNEFKKITLLVALANSFGSTITGLVTVSPFFLAALKIISISEAYNFSFILVALILITIGGATAIIARESRLLHAATAVLAGLMVGLIVYLFELLKFA